jgi:glucose/arabinose dehydrogenase
MSDCGKHVRLGRLAVAAFAVAAAGAGAQESASAPRAAPTLPAGFAATLFAAGLPTPRHIAVRANGDVYVTLRSGAAKIRPTEEPGGITALRDTNGDGVADIARTFGTPDIDTGLAIHDGRLFYASTTTIYAVALGDDLVPTAPAEIVVADLPESGSGHRTKPITFDGAGHLLTQIGSPSNACQAQAGTPGSPGLMPCTLLEAHGGVFRFDAAARNQDGRAGERYSTGHRNVVALEWNAAAGALYALMHGRDGLNQLWPEHFSADADARTPAEEFHRIEAGANLGWPYTYYDAQRRQRMVMPEYGGDGATAAQPGRYQDPLLAFPAHWAPNDLVFYAGTSFPGRYRNAAFIAFHGSPTARRAGASGAAVVVVPMSATGVPTGEAEIFAGEFDAVLTRDGVAGRPSGLAVGPDGALYVGDDAGGRIWKITYRGGGTAR